MADYFRIDGGHALQGTIAPMGNKNAALPLLAAALLTDEPLVVRNVPDIGDVRTKLALLESMGVSTSLEDNVCRLDAARRAGRQSGSRAVEPHPHRRVAVGTLARPLWPRRDRSPGR